MLREHCWKQADSQHHTYEFDDEGAGRYMGHQQLNLPTTTTKYQCCKVGEVS